MFNLEIYVGIANKEIKAMGDRLANTLVEVKTPEMRMDQKNVALWKHACNSGVGIVMQLTNNCKG